MGISGSGPRDVWAVGLGGGMLHYDGASWLPSPVGTSAHLSSVWAASESDAWAVGAEGTLLHYDGSRWAQ